MYLFERLDFFFLFLNFLNTYLLLRDRETQSVSRGGVETGGDTESEAGSRLWAVSTELNAGLELTNCKIMTWTEVCRLTNWATQVTRLDFFLNESPFLPTSPVISLLFFKNLRASLKNFTVFDSVYCCYLFFIYLFSYFNSTYEWNHMILYFSVWLISLSLKPSRSIHVAANGKISFSFMDTNKQTNKTDS